jgi:spermidine synthase
VVVAELAPEVVEWNRGPLAPLAGYPLDDERVKIREMDVARLLRGQHGAYDAVLLDVDNGPEGLTRKDNDWLYTRAGLSSARTALRPGGVLAIWSASPEPAFTRRLRLVGFRVDVVQARANGSAKGGRHTIWLANRGA